jgi:hypothetical protein
MKKGLSFVDFNLLRLRGVEILPSDLGRSSQQPNNTLTNKEYPMETEFRPPEGTQLIQSIEELKDITATPSLIRNNDDEAQIDPHRFAPVPDRKNSEEQRTKTSLLFVLFEYCLKNSILELQFPDDCSTIWRLEKFVNASFHSDFQLSVTKWRVRILEDEVLRKRLIKQHSFELQRLTYPLPKRRGNRPKRKRGYSDKGSTRPLHQRFRTDKDTVTAVYLQDLSTTKKVVVYGRRPTVTYRRLPYSEEIGRLLGLGLLKIEGDFIIPSGLKED